uniref:Uncharacterized protein n=1 Tax=Siphoviridae sp. ctTnV63 TaxID=2825523 RepID=A0A8S5NV00_9CAUD|nr:MAG TPA: hypothetical protein [Siphoviridae sp. ctTnV63]
MYIFRQNDKKCRQYVFTYCRVGNRKKFFFFRKSGSL